MSPGEQKVSSDSRRDHALSGGLRAAGTLKSGSPARPLVTVVTSAMNACRMLPVTIESVCGQTYDNVEYVVVDGNSSDGTVELLREHSDVIDYWHSAKDTGIYDAWNKALQHARGDWIAFLGAGDRLVPDAIESLVRMVTSASAPLDFVSGRVDLYQGERFIRTVGRPWDWATFKKYMGVAHPAALHSAAYFARHGRFDASLRIVGDYELLLRAGAGLKAAFLDKSLALMEVGGTSTTDAALKETLQVQLRHGVCAAPVGHMRMWQARLKRKVRLAVHGY